MGAATGNASSLTLRGDDLPVAYDVPGPDVSRVSGQPFEVQIAKINAKIKG